MSGDHGFGKPGTKREGAVIPESEKGARPRPMSPSQRIRKLIAERYVVREVDSRKFVSVTDLFELAKELEYEEESGW